MKAKKCQKKNSSNFFFNIFFFAEVTPPSTPESFTLMGLAMWESISFQLGKSAVLSYQSLARYRSLGFDKSPHYPIFSLSDNHCIKFQEALLGLLQLPLLRGPAPHAVQIARGFPVSLMEEELLPEMEYYLSGNSINSSLKTRRGIKLAFCR